MEFPDLGKHCWESTCNKLDFLPVICDGCDKIFCSEHFSYAKHICLSSHQKDNQVPVCPLCGVPVPTEPGSSPDRSVNEHINQFCKPQTKKVFINWCLVKECKMKEIIPFQCSVCKLNFCLRHRFTTDHNCKGHQDTIISLSTVPETIQLNTIEDQAPSVIEVEHSQYWNRPEQVKYTSLFKVICIYIGIIIVLTTIIIKIAFW